MAEQYRILPGKKGHDSILIVSGNFSGISYIYGDVRLFENESPIRLWFEHTVLENMYGVDIESNYDAFKQVIGDILIDLFERTSTSDTDDSSQ